MGAPQPESMANAQSERMKKQWAQMTKKERENLNKKRGESVRRYWASKTSEDRRIQMLPATTASAKMHRKK